MDCSLRAMPKLYRMWSPWPSGTTGKTSGCGVVADRARCGRPTSSIDHDGRYTPGVSATTAVATRPASAMSISPVIEQDSCASQPTRARPVRGPSADRPTCRCLRPFASRPRARSRCSSRRRRRLRSPRRWTARSRPPWRPHSWPRSWFPYSPPIDDVSTMRPYPASHITGNAGRTTWNAPRRWTSRTASKSS